MFIRRFALAVGVVCLLVPSVEASRGANRANRQAMMAARMAQRSAAYRNGLMPVGATARSTGDVQSLRQAYQMLSTADHDYKGYRVKAMHSIRAAARMMGTRLAAPPTTKGQGKGQEQQAASDARLQQAQTILQKVRGTVQGGSSQQVVHHLDLAMQHLSTALSIK